MTGGKTGHKAPVVESILCHECLVERFLKLALQLVGESHYGIFGCLGARDRVSNSVSTLIYIKN